MIPLLEIKNLTIRFFTDDGVIHAVEDFSFSLPKNKTLGIVGESGSGKSVTALSILRLIPSPGKILRGQILFEGTDILTLPESELYKIRGNRISMIFQDPMTSLNPLFTVGYQIAEAVTAHQKVSRQEAKSRALALLEAVKIPEAKKRFNAYPHQLSGGMRQRVMIAMALSCNPSLLIADEPTTALDVTVQKQILELIAELQKDFQMSVILITHNLGIISEVCDQVLVMYAGRCVEEGPVSSIFRAPRHPYTFGLLRSVEKMIPIPGQLPILKESAVACTFAPRCFLAAEKCRQGEPPLFDVEENHQSRCWFHDQVQI